MPYINRERRYDLNFEGHAKTSGELNYKITKLLDSYISEKGLGYSAINEVIGVLECAKQELYRRVAAPYEDKKCRENGEVYLNV